MILISDFQRTGWQGAEGVRLPDGVVLTPVPIVDNATANVSVTPVSIQRATFSEQDRVTVTGGVTNHGPVAVSNLEITLEIDGRAVQTERINVDQHSSASVTFAAFTPAARDTRGTVQIGADALAVDNAFHFLVSPKAPLRIVIAERPGAPRDASLYLSRALALGDAPPFDIAAKSIDALTTDDLQRASVVILNDVPVRAADRPNGSARSWRAAAACWSRSASGRPGRPAPAAPPTSCPRRRGSRSIAPRGRPDGSARSNTATRSSSRSARRAAAIFPARGSTATAP